MYLGTVFIPSVPRQARWGAARESGGVIHCMRGARPRRAARGGRMAGRACSNWRETGTKRRSVDALRQLTRVCCVPIHHRTPTAVSIASSASIYGHSVVHTAFPGTSRSPLSPYIPWALECVSPRSPPLDPLEVCMISHLRAGGGLRPASPAPLHGRCSHAVAGFEQTQRCLPVHMVHIHKP